MREEFQEALELWKLTGDQRSMEKFNANVLFHFVYVCAMRDAVLQKAYAGEKKWLWTTETICAENRIKEYIDHILEVGFQDQDEHDNEFMNVVLDVCNIINEKIMMDNREGHFSFGNAQKLINIICKYFYVICYRDTALKENFKCCHCPMDSILLDHVWEKIKKQVDIKGKEFRKSWGKEEVKNVDGNNYELPERYRLFQEKIRDLAGEKNVFPIEYDFLIWENE